jgi:hypothetical protein
VLCPVAAIGALLSFQSLHEAATPVFGPLAVGFPLLVDMLILGSTLAFLRGAIGGRPLPGWRWTAHGGVSGTLLLNALAAETPTAIAWHITPALVWSVLVEMTARQVLDHPSPHHDSQQIPRRIWLTNPRHAAAIWLHMARTGHHDHRQARTDLAIRAAARLALTTALPRRRQRRARRLILRQLRDGVLDPTHLLNHLHGRDITRADGPTTVVIQAFLDDLPTIRTRPGARDRPQARAAITAHASAPPTKPGPPSKQEHPAGSAVSPRPAPTRKPDDRLHLALELLRTRPGLTAVQLAGELAAEGWPVSERTAGRVLARARQERAGSVADADRTTATGSPGGDGPDHR